MPSALDKRYFLLRTVEGSATYSWVLRSPLGTPEYSRADLERANVGAVPELRLGERPCAPPLSTQITPLSTQSTPVSTESAPVSTQSTPCEYSEYPVSTQRTSCEYS